MRYSLLSLSHTVTAHSQWVIAVLCVHVECIYVFDTSPMYGCVLLDEITMPHPGDIACTRLCLEVDRTNTHQSEFFHQLHNLLVLFLNSLHGRMGATAG